MARTSEAEEVQIVRWFQTAQIEKAEVVFNILCDSMHERLRGRQTAETAIARTGTARKRSLRPNAESIQDGNTTGDLAV